MSLSGKVNNSYGLTVTNTGLHMLFNCARKRPAGVLHAAVLTLFPLRLDKSLVQAVLSCLVALRLLTFTNFSSRQMKSARDT